MSELLQLFGRFGSAGLMAVLFLLLLEVVGVSRIIIIVTAIVLASFLAVLKANVYGVRTRLRELSHIPPSPDESKPRLTISLGRLTKDNIAMQDGRKVKCSFPSIIVENTGSENAEECKLQLSIRDKKGIVDFNLADPKQLGITGAQITTDEPRRWNLFELLNKYDKSFGDAYELTGHLFLLDRTFVAKASATYKAEDRIRRFATEEHVFHFYWFQESPSANEIKLAVPVQTSYSRR